MIDIHRSHKLETIAGKLAKDLKSVSPEDPLVPIEIVVPNRDTARWLKLYLAEKNDIIANVSFLLPAEWQFNMIRKLYPGLPKVLPSDPGPLTWSIFELLMDDEGRKSFQGPDRYISFQPDEIKERAVLQLSGKIASVYDQYLVYRPELIIKWQRDSEFDNPDEAWQAALWRALEKKRFGREKGQGYPNKAMLIRETRHELSNGTITPDNDLLFFNTGLMPKPILDMAEAASGDSDLYLYQTAATKQLTSDSQNPLLQAYGDEAAGLQILLDGLNAREIKDFDTDHSDDSSLSLIKESVLEDNEIKPGPKGKLEGVEVHSCHSALREVEVLHQFLLRQFQDDPNLHPDDILVVMPDLDTYTPVIHAVFGTNQDGIPSIPYQVDYRKLSTESMIRPFLQLLDLPDSRFRLSDVMDLFMDPTVRDAFGVTESSAERVKQWMDENNVIWGLDSNHRSEEGQPGVISRTWKSALRRGWEGLLHGQKEEPFEDVANQRFADIRGQEMEEVWAGFSRFMTQLQSLRDETKAKKKPADWCTTLADIEKRFLSTERQPAGKTSPLKQALDSLNKELEASGPGRKISFSLFRSYIRKHLDRKSASPAHFTRGVTFSSMVPVRSIPAKIVALIGLNESDFPRKPKSIDFDLMAGDPRPYERNSKNQDRSLFLESILASKSIHYCSYIGRSQTDNEIIPPSPIVSEWLSILSKISGLEPDEILVEEPLHAFSGDNFIRSKSFSGAAYRTAVNLQSDTVSLNGLSQGQKINLVDDHKELTVNEITSFISNPLRFFFSHHFKPRLSYSEQLAKEFELDALQKHLLFQRLFGWRLQGHSADAISSILLETGSVPDGWQGEQTVNEFLESADQAIISAKSLGYDLSISHHGVNLEIGDFVIGGDIESFSERQLLDVTISGHSGDRLIQSWIRHLITQRSGLFSEQESLFLSDLKKGKPKWFKFMPLKDPEAELIRYLTLYREGLSKPVMMFPNASYRYQEAIIDGKNEKEAYIKAAMEFEGNDYSPYSENMDFSVTLMLGEGAPFNKDYLNARFLEGIRVMIENREEIE